MLRKGRERLRNDAHWTPDSNTFRSVEMESGSFPELNGAREIEGFLKGFERLRQVSDKPIVLRINMLCNQAVFPSFLKHDVGRAPAKLQPAAVRRPAA